MEDYVSRQRQRWNGSSGGSSLAQEPRTVTPPPMDPIDPFNLNKIHIVPLQEETESSESERLPLVVEFLKNSMISKAVVTTGTTFLSSGKRFVVVKTEPEQGGQVTAQTDFYVNGPAASILSKVQLVGLIEPLDDSQQANMDAISDRLFGEVLSPFIQSRVKEDGSTVLPVYMNNVLTAGSQRFVVTAMDPSPPSDGIGVIDINTMTFIDVETSGDFTRIHVLPFQDTLPRVYDFDVFEDYLRPFFMMNPMAVYSVNTQFAFHGVQFKVVCVDPSDRRPRRIGPNTVIHCEGLLHATLRNMLPPELLEQLSTLPPGLQMLLINTELLASADVLDRFIDLQETLAARRGISPELLNSLPIESYHAPEGNVERPESASQCMICLSDFEEGESLRRLPCTHVFHQACIDEWLLHRSTSCCLCKVDVDRAVAGRH